MARRDSQQDPSEQNEDRGVGTGDEGRMPAGDADVRGIAPGEDASELEDDELEDDDEEEEGGGSF